VKYKNETTDWLKEELKKIKYFLLKARMKSNYQIALSIKSEIEDEIKRRENEI